MSIDTPLRTEHDIVHLIASTVGPAEDRRLWCFFLDLDDRAVKTSLCVDDLPARPERVGVAEVGRGLRTAAGAVGAERVVLVWERPGRSALDPMDSLWLHALSDACTSSGLPVRAAVLSHDDGVRAVAPAEHGF